MLHPVVAGARFQLKAGKRALPDPKHAEGAGVHRRSKSLFADGGKLTVAVLRAEGAVPARPVPMGQLQARLPSFAGEYRAVGCVALGVLVVVDADAQIRHGEARQGFVQRGFQIDSRLLHFQQGQVFVAVLALVLVLVVMLIFFVVFILVVMFIFVVVFILVVTMLVFVAMRVAVPRYAVLGVEMAYRHTEKTAFADE